MKFPNSAVLALVALVLAFLAILEFVRAGTALSLAIILLSLAFLLPSVPGLRNRERW